MSRQSKRQRKRAFNLGPAVYKYKFQIPLGKDTELYYGTRNGKPAIGIKGRF